MSANTNVTYVPAQPILGHITQPVDKLAMGTYVHLQI